MDDTIGMIPFTVNEIRRLWATHTAPHTPAGTPEPAPTGDAAANSTPNAVTTSADSKITSHGCSTSRRAVPHPRDDVWRDFYA
jgi:hypothetical protein